MQVHTFSLWSRFWSSQLRIILKLFLMIILHQGFLGCKTSSGGMPAISVGQTLDLWVYNCYLGKWAFSEELSKQQQQKQQRRRRRWQQRCCLCCEHFTKQLLHSPHTRMYLQLNYSIYAVLLQSVYGMCFLILVFKLPSAAAGRSSAF